MKKELKDLSALEIGLLVREREISPVKVVEYFLDRIKKSNLNAFTYTKDDEALEAASKLEKEIKAGKRVMGLFAGVPFALKDFLPSKKGWTNTHGGVKCLETVDSSDSVFCKAMESAGGIAIGKTNAPAFGFRGTCDNKLYGPTKNPYNLDYNSGGSSGGSAAAVAAGLVPIAEGGDAGGSIRIPAAWCNCYGFKATYGRIPSVCRPDAWAASHPYCVPGGLTKTVADARELFYLMEELDYRDPLNVPLANSGFPKYQPNIKVAVSLDFGGLFDFVDPEIVSKVEAVADFLEKEGATVYRIDTYLKDTRPKYTLKELAEMWCKHISVDSMLEFEDLKNRGKFDLIGEYREDLPEEFIYWYEKAKNLTVFDFYEFNKVRTEFLDKFFNVFENCDILLSPVTTCLPVLNDPVKGETKGSGNCEQLIGFAETFLYNLTGHPAASCPVGFSKSGLPIGVQIASERFHDRMVLSVSEVLEKHKNRFE